MIKAIETRYNGYRFRSRLEARWAYFFDALEIEYQYEPEGFDLGEAGWYLPDFYLPKARFFFEVKPVPLTSTERKKLQALDDHPPQYAFGCSALIGPPEIPELDISGSTFETAVLERMRGNIVFLLVWEWGIPKLVKSYLAIEKAVTAARSVRFEHGETPKGPRV